MNRNLGQFIVQSNWEAATGVASPADVASREAVMTRRRGGHDDCWGGEASEEGEEGGEEVANASEVTIAGGSDSKASEAGCLQGFLFSIELFRFFMDN